jgi:tRNA-splicing endonuclease subunit Sen34
MVGGVAAFKQQNAVHGLPLQLSEEEVTLALERGWADLQGAPDLDGAMDGALPSDTRGSKRARRAPGYHQRDHHDDDSEDDDEINFSDEDGPRAPPPVVQAAWKDALASSRHYELPTTPADVEEAARPLTNAPTATPPWSFPSTREERHRYLVFRDLHTRGYRTTGGSKFGADFLAYPGDPTLYHAQFCLRLAPADVAIAPVVMAAWCRGSFQARKHLLLASVIGGEEGGEEEEERILYSTLGPVDGFG